MIVEYICYRIPVDRASAFEDAYRAASASLDASPHCERFDVARCTEDPSSYIVRIEWDSIRGHLDGFRSSPQFARFFAAVRPFIGQIEEMRHYRITAASA